MSHIRNKIDLTTDATQIVRITGNIMNHFTLRNLAIYNQIDNYS